MSFNLKGYFCGRPVKLEDKEIKYRVSIVSDEVTGEDAEMDMSANSPFLVSYNSDTNVFASTRISTASINIISSDYLLDIFSPCAQGTKVILEELPEEGSPIVKWLGYLRPNLSNMGYSNCVDYVTLEASDALASLQYFDYAPLNGEMVSIVSFKDILAKATELAGLSKFSFAMCKTTENGVYIRPEDLKISERNFYTTDTDDAWKYSEVLDEMCKYLGMTIFQWGDTFYVIDNQSFLLSSSLSLFNYVNGAYVSEGTIGGGLQYIDKQNYRGNGNDISVDNVYNKIIVKDNFMTIDEFIPDMFNDDYLINRQGDFWKSNVQYGAGKRDYIKPNGFVGTEKTGDEKYQYYLRSFDNQYYESIYRDKNTLAETTPTAVSLKVLSQVLTPFADDVIEVRFINNGNSSATVNAYYEKRFDYEDPTGMPDYDTWTDHSSFSIGAHSDVVKTFDVSGLLPPEDVDRYQGPYYRGYYTVSGLGYNEFQFGQGTPTDEGNYVGGTIVDFAYMEVDNDTQRYNYEVPNSISFDRYLLIKQFEKPDGWLNPQISGQIWTPLTPTNLHRYFPPIFKLKDNYNNPMIVSDGTYLAIDFTAMHQRYARNYFNPDWTDRCSDDKVFFTNWLNKTDGIGICAPSFNFQLKIGNKYYNGTSWTTTESSFYIPLSTETKKDGGVDFKRMYNAEHHVLNNISWTEWVGAKGYKVQLDPSLDFTQGIMLKVLMPTKIQYVSRKDGYYGDGVNGCVWVKNFDIKLITKDQENYPLADVEYSAEINECSLNEYPSINCKYTTYPGHGKNSYSNVGFKNTGLLKGMKDTGLMSPAFQKPEENLIDKYYNQYSTPTITERLTVDMSYTPLHSIKDMYWEDEKRFVVTGMDINYMDGIENLQITQIKP